MKKKIGGVIVSYLEHTNYGSSLQAYATMKIVQALGYDFTFIKYQKHRNLMDWLKIIPGLILSGGLELIKNKLTYRFNCFIHPTYSSNQMIRKQEARNFKEKEFLPYFKTYVGYKNLCEGSKEYDAIFVGSDQTWRPYGFYSNYWNLIFVDDSIPKFSYAASYGVSQIPIVQKKGTKKYLERLNMISVREQKGKEIIESISNKKAQVVADPTMLIEKDEWMNFAKKSKYQLPIEKYIFCYFLGKRKDIREEVQKLAKATNLKIVTMRHMDEYIPMDETFGDYFPYNINPYDFVNLLANAEYVCTDSFHGTVFSIIMHKKFCTFYRIKPTHHNSTHSRIDNLLNIFKLNEQKFSGNILNITKDIDYNTVDKILINYRKESLDFFQTALALSYTHKQIN